MKTRYLNPFTDFGFFRIFGREAGKELLMDFLNQVLPSRFHISALSFFQSFRERDPELKGGHVISLYCKNMEGEAFTLEFRKVGKHLLEKGGGFFALFPFRGEEENSNDFRWDFRVTPVCRIALLEGLLDESREQSDMVSYVRLTDQYGQALQENLFFILIEAPRFSRTLGQLETRLDKWLYFLLHIDTLDGITPEFREYIFLKAFQLAERAELNIEEEAAYSESLRQYWQLRAGGVSRAGNKGDGWSGEESGADSASSADKPFLELEARKLRKIAQALKSQGFSLDKIAALLKISADEVEAIL